ncbi:MAG: ABC transporter substrate-binding protein [Acetobacteraceae bacterium]|nr:ABC transporter substrate-binding protein [Acetobacteraceae bacterium]
MAPSWLRAALCAGLTAFAMPAMAADAPSEIKIGTLYAGSGQLASASVPLHVALEWWADQVNKDGGVMVKGFGKKIPVRLISYDDQSSPSLAANLTNQLITQDKVDVLLSDSTSVMTASSVPVARDHKQLLFDVTGSSPNFFSPDNKYIVLLGLASTDRYPKSIADFVGQMPKLGIKSVAILYNTADYTAFQALAVRRAVEANKELKLVFDRGVPANTTDYTLLVNNVEAAKPDALLEFGYPANEIAFLHAMQDNGSKFKFLFTGYGLTELPLMKTNGVSDQLAYSYALASSAVYAFKPNYGLDLEQFKEAFEHWVTSHKLPGVEFGFNALAGYQAGLVIERTLQAAESLDQLELRRAVFSLSGNMTTLAGPFVLAPDGSQMGEILPLGQIVPGKELVGEYKLNIVWPEDLATAKPIYPAP